MQAGQSQRWCYRRSRGHLPKASPPLFRRSRPQISPTTDGAACKADFLIAHTPASVVGEDGPTYDVAVRLLDITADIGPAAPPASLESLIRGIRVAVDVAREADLRSIRRGAVEQMKFPTDSELRDAIERFPQDDERSPHYRAQRQLEARQRFRDELGNAPPEIWFDWFYRRGRSRLGKQDHVLSEAGFERLLSAAPLPALTNAIGLDVLDPDLYQALVSDSVARLMPTAVGVRQLHYENPFLARIFGKGTAEATISTTAQVIETVGTLRSTVKKAGVEAKVAERTLDDRVEKSSLDVELQRLRVEREREALAADRIANARSADELYGNRRQQAIIEAAMRQGLLDIADAVGELDPSEATALGELGLRSVELQEHNEIDDSEGDTRLS
jgi:hypothetical protein